MGQSGGDDSDGDVRWVMMIVMMVIVMMVIVMVMGGGSAKVSRAVFK